MKRISLTILFFFLPSLILCQAITWSKVYGANTFVESASTVRQTQDGGYVVCGWTDGFGNRDFYIIKTDSAGHAVGDIKGLN